MSVKPDKGGGVSLALGDLLTAEDPVWVWDVRARRILWANRGGLAFWEADTLESLRERRFDPRNKTLSRIAALSAEAGSRTREWTETLVFPGRAGRRASTCYMQSLEVAGGRPGLIVRALPPAAEPPPPAAEPPAEAEPDTAEANGDRAAFAAVAAQLEQAQAVRRRKTRRAQEKPSLARAAQPSPADAAAKAYPAFIRELCHELRNPLTVVIGFAERIRDSDNSREASKAKAYAENILEGAHLALEILRNFAGRLQNGEAVKPAEPVDVKAAVESCLRLVAPLAKQGGLSLGKSLGRRLPRLNAEDRALKQVLLNLLINAIRHQKTGGRISVAARRRRGGDLLITVSDDGIGMTKKEIKAALGGKRRANGGAGPISGLGLPLVKRLVETAGGTIAIESLRRKGTTVEIRFPATSLTAAEPR